MNLNKNVNYDMDQRVKATLFCLDCRLPNHVAALRELIAAEQQVNKIHREQFLAETVK